MSKADHSLLPSHRPRAGVVLFVYFFTFYSATELLSICFSKLLFRYFPDVFPLASR